MCKINTEHWTIPTFRLTSEEKHGKKEVLTWPWYKDKCSQQVNAAGKTWTKWHVVCFLYHYNNVYYNVHNIINIQFLFTINTSIWTHVVHRWEVTVDIAHTYLVSLPTTVHLYNIIVFFFFHILPRIRMNTTDL